MQRNIRFLILPLLLAVLLNGCLPGAGQPTPSPTASITATRLPTLAPTDTPTPRPSPTRITQPAEEAVRTYLQTLQAGDAAAAAEQLSAFSLLAANLSRAQAQEKLQAQMDAGRIRSFTLGSTEQISENSVVVSVRWQVQGQDKPNEAYWAARLEEGRWRPNWDNVIDFRTLYVTEKSSNDIAVLPLQITRYANFLRLQVLVQNSSERTASWGSKDEVAAIFHFDAEQREARAAGKLYAGLRSYPNEFIDLPGLFRAYPTRVDLMNFRYLRDYPWHYRFDLR